MNPEKLPVMRRVLKSEHNKPGSIYQIRGTYYRIGPRGNSIRLTPLEMEAMRKIGEQLKADAVTKTA